MKALIGTTIIAMMAANAQAVIIDGWSTTRPRDHGAGGFAKIADPSGLSVGRDNFNSPNFYGFDEMQGVTHEGETLNSHYIFFDPETKGENDGYNLHGWVLFDSPIVEIIEDRSRQMTSDDIFGLSSVSYWYPTLIGLEPGNTARIDPSDANRLLWDTNASTPGDWIRVLTAGSDTPVGVPDTGSTAAFATAGLILLFALRKFRVS